MANYQRQSCITGNKIVGALRSQCGGIMKPISTLEYHGEWSCASAADPADPVQAGCTNKCAGINIRVCKCAFVCG